MIEFSERYHREGWAFLRNRIPVELVQAARVYSYDLYQREGGRFARFGAYEHKDGTHWHRKHVHELDAVRPLLGYLPVQTLLGRGGRLGSVCAITHSKFSFKRCGEAQEWAPHQDAAYKAIPGRGVVYAIPLEDVYLDSGTLALLPGSHARGLLAHRPARDRQQIELAEPCAGDFEPFVARQGDLAAFSLFTVHRSGSNVRSGLRAFLFVEVEPYFEGLKDGDFGGEPTIIHTRD